MSQTELDCRGLSCPMPIVKISRAVKELGVGDELRVQASDPSFRADLEAWVTKMGHALKSFESAAGVQTAIICKQA
ncbi:MAG: sulfurtransferase TusA family protein [Planctomycetaceae bacterium]|jgi:tRNA 2-thiouridine synthesizing protein A